MSAAVEKEPPPSGLHDRLGAPVSIPRDRLLGRAGIPPAPPVPVVLLAWGVTDADVQRAIDRAGIGAGRTGWEFDVRPTRKVPCPLDLEDKRAIAAEAGADWAYVAYRAGTVR